MTSPTPLISDCGFQIAERRTAPGSRTDARRNSAIRNPQSAIVLASAVLLLAGLSGGCAVLFPKNPHVEAKGRWDQVRGRIKLQLAQEQFEAGRLREAES